MEATIGDYWRQRYAAGGGLFTTAFSQRLGAIIAFCASRLNLTPNMLTSMSFVVSFVASLAYAFLPSGYSSIMYCLILYQIAYAFDCADGQLARSTNSSSDFGAWLDMVSDLSGMIFMAFCVSYWFVHHGQVVLWLCFLSPMLMVVGRSMTLFSSKFTQRRGNEGSKAGQNIGPMKKAVWMVIDTPTLLLMTCLLRDAPIYLSIYLLLMGCLYLVNASYLALVRLER